MYIIDDFSNEFTKLAVVNSDNIICDESFDDFICNEIINYSETGDKKFILNAASIIINLRENGIKNGTWGKYQHVSWAGMREFSHYPLIQRVKLFLEVRNRTDNDIFILELFELLHDVYDI